MSQSCECPHSPETSYFYRLVVIPPPAQAIETETRVDRVPRRTR